MYSFQYAVTCLFFVTYFFKNSGSNRFLKYVKSCPDSRENWIIKTRITLCEDGLFYHCIRERMGNLVEACLNVYDLPSKDECPVIQIEDEDIIPGFHQIKCTISNNSCPPENGTFSSNLLFLYPGCINSDIEHSSSKVFISFSSFSVSTYRVDVTSAVNHIETTEQFRDDNDDIMSWWSNIKDFFGEIPLVGGLVVIIFIAIIVTALVIVIRRNRIYRAQLEQARYVAPIQLDAPALHTYDEVNNDNIDRKSSDNSDNSSYLEPVTSSPGIQHLKTSQSDSVIDITNVDTPTEPKQYVQQPP